MKRIFHRILCAALLGGVMLVSANVARAQEDDPIPLRSSKPVLPDPVRGTGWNAPAATVTAGTAYGGAPKDTPSAGCTPLNPCAVPSSAPHQLGSVPGLSK